MAIDGLQTAAWSQRVARVSHLVMGWTVLSIVTVVPFLLDLSNLADTYYAPKARALYVLTPLIAGAWIVRAFLAPETVDREILRPAAAFGAIAVAATMVSVNPAWSLWGAPWRHEGLYTLLAYIAVFLGSTALAAGPLPRRWLIATLAGASVVALYGVVQYLGYDPLIRDSHRLDWWQAFSTAGHPNFLGAYMALTLPLSLVAVLTARTRISLIVALLTVTVIFLAALFTYSRAAWAAQAVTLGVFSLLAWRGRHLHRGRRYVLTVLWLASLATLFLLPHGPLAPRGAAPTPLVRAGSVLERQSPLMRTRPYLWRQTLRLLLRRPILGYGPETLPLVFPQDWNTEKRQLFGPDALVIDKAHNETLDMAMSLGLAGVVAFWWLVVVVVRRAWRKVRAGRGQALLAMAALAGIAGYLLDLQFQFSVVSVAPAFYSVLGVAVAGPVVEREVRDAH